LPPREDVAEHGRGAHPDPVAHRLRRAEQLRPPPRRCEALEGVEQVDAEERRQAGARPREGARRVGRTDIAAADAAHVDALDRAHDDPRPRQRTEQKRQQATEHQGHGSGK
jgi:hypothetical protein